MHVFEIDPDPMSVGEHPTGDSAEATKAGFEPVADVYALDPGTTDLVPSFEPGIGDVYLAGPSAAYGEARRLWLPLPAGYDVDDVVFYYYHACGNDRGWYLGDNIAGWLVEDSHLTLTENGVTYIGVLVRHGGIVQLGRAVVNAPDRPAATLSPAGVLLGTLVVLLLSALRRPVGRLRRSAPVPTKNTL